MSEQQTTKAKRVAQFEINDAVRAYLTEKGAAIVYGKTPSGAEQFQFCIRPNMLQHMPGFEMILESQAWLDIQETKANSKLETEIKVKQAKLQAQLAKLKQAGLTPEDAIKYLKG